MRSASALILEDPEAETTGTYAASVGGAVDLAEAYLLRAGRGASSAEVDRAIEQVRRAVEVLTDLQERLEALQWDMESEEMDAELRQRGYVQTSADAWTSPAGERALSQFQALLQVDEGGPPVVRGDESSGLHWSSAAPLTEEPCRRPGAGPGGEG